LLLLPALLLAACGQSSTSITQPVMSAPVAITPAGVYQISFQKVGSPDFSVSAQSLTASGLQTQGLVSTPDAFTFARVANSTFVVAATSLRHVQATFRVTNNTGLTLNSLKFVPVIPTGKSSVFSGVTYYDGSDASSKASSLTTVQGQNFDLTTLQATTDGSASPYVTGLDVSGVDTTGKNISSVKPYGWQASATLAPGGVAVVTFAVDLPADANPKNDPFNFSLNVISVQEGATLTSAVQQYSRTTRSYGNYSQFPTSGATSLPAYYDLRNVDRTGASVASVLCSFDGAVISNISTASFPNRYRVSVTSLGNHTVQAYAGTSCPATAGTPLVSQTAVGVAAQKVPLAGGDSHSLALEADATVRAWGDNFSGQLGDGTYSRVNSLPVTVSGLTDVVSLAGGYAHSLALKADGTVRSWGANQSGQLGNSTVPYFSNTPVSVTGLTGVVGIASGTNHSLALRSDGTVCSWGANSVGQLGNGTTTNSNTPVTVSGLTDVVSIAGGDAHSLALRADGTVRSWGSNDAGQLGNGTAPDSNMPVTVSGLTDVVGLAGGSRHSLALKSDGTVRSWGSNDSGQLGNGTFNYSSNTPVLVTGLTGVVGVASGSNHSLALKSDGTVRSWGSNQDGQLGDGGTTDTRTPVTVLGLTDAVGLAGGSRHSLALKSDGTMRSWGYNIAGQLGDGTTTYSSTPVNTVISGVAQPTP